MSLWNTSNEDSNSYNGDYDNFYVEQDGIYEKSIFAAIREGKFKDVALLIESPDVSLETCYRCISLAVSCNQTEAAKLILQRRFQVRGNLRAIKYKIEEGVHSYRLVKSNRKWHCPASDFPEKLMALAIDKGESKVVKLLLNSGVNVHSMILNSYTSVQVAVLKQHTQIVEHLLINGAYVNSRYPEDTECTLLHRAVEKKNEDIVKLLVKYGADINATRRDNGITALHIAAEQGFVEITEFLIKEGAHINDVAFPSSKLKTGFEEYLLRRCTVEIKGRSPLQLAAQNFHAEVIKLLLENGANWHDFSKASFFSLLHVAVANKNKAIVKLLMDFKANPNVEDNDGVTPLLSALNASDSEIALLLLENGANVNDELCLLLAVTSCTADVVQFFLGKGIEADHKISRKNATKVLYSNIFEYRLTLLEIYDDCTLLFIAAEEGRFDTIKLLLEKGANIFASTNTGITVLDAAAEGGHYQIAELLLKFGAELTVDPCDGTCKILSIAAHKSRWKFIEVFLLKLGTTQIEKTWPGTLRLIINKAINVKGTEEYAKVLIIILSSGANISLTQDEGKKLLSNAIEMNSEKLVEILLGCIRQTAFPTPKKSQRHKSKTPKYRKYYSNPFLECAKKDNYRIIESLLKSVPSIYTVTHDEKGTALHIGAEHGYINVVKTLLKYGAGVDCKKTGGQTPLFISASEGYLSIVEILLQSGAKVDLRDDDGRSPVYNASEKGHTEIVKLLLENKAKPNIKTKEGDTALSIAAQKAYPAIIEVLIKYGASIYTSDKKGETPLFKVAEKGNLELVQRLLKLGATANCKTRANQTPLSIAARNGHLQIVEELLKSGATINPTNHKEELPLYNAAEEGHKNIVTLLLAYGAMIEAKNSYGNTALSAAVCGNHLSIVKELLRSGANVNSADEKGRSPIYQTVKWQDDDDFGKMTEMIVLLLEHDADPNFQDEQHQTPLIVCTEQCRSEEIFETLLRHGAKTNVQDKEGKTALHYSAAKERGIKRVKLLLELGADVDTKDEKGCTPLFSAVSHGALENINALLEAGADIDATDSEGRSILEIYAKSDLEKDFENDVEIIQFLFSFGAKIRAQLVIDLQKLISPDYLTNYEHSILIRNMVAISEVNLERAKEAKVLLETEYIHDYFQIEHHQNKCKAEVSRMKTETIGDTNTTFYEFLTKNWRDLALFTKNDAALDAFKTNAHEVAFPMYSNLINIQIRKGERGKNLMKQGIKHGWYLFNHYADVPYDILEKILDYLSIKDLRMLILVGQAIKANLQGKLSGSLSLEEINLFEP